MTNLREAESSIDERILLVHAYVDGELDPLNSVAIDRQIAADPVLGAEFERIQALRRVVSERIPREEVSPQLLSKIETAIGRSSRPANPTWRALAASVLVAAGLASGSTWFALHSPSGDDFADGVIDGHMRALLAPQPVDVPSSEGHTVKPWFNGRIAQSPQVVDLSKDGFPLVGGRVDVAGTTPAATLVYGRRLHLISVTTQQTGASTAAPSAGQSIKGYNLVHWSENGTTYWAASDLNVAELLTFARLFQSGLTGHG
jgi:anti-sigma factor RsiW